MNNALVQLSLASVFAVFLGVLVTVPCFGGEAVGLVRGTEPAPFVTGRSVGDRRLAEEWLNAVRGGRIEAALKAARELTAGERGSTEGETRLAQSYFSRLRTSPSHVTADFNVWDFQSWWNALFFKEASKAILADSSEKRVVPALFKAVTERLKNGDAKNDGAPWPFVIWKFRKGTCDQQAWTLCELAYQRGCQPRIVYLYPSADGLSCHTICELREGDKVWTADPFSNVLLEGLSVKELAKQPDTLKKIWPDRPQWREAVKRTRSFIPCDPGDYCPRNRALAAKLATLIPDEAPRFGENPFTRHRLANAAEADESAIDTWFFPIRLLQSQMSARERKRRKRIDAGGE